MALKILTEFKALERELKTQLVYRRRGGVELTRTGKRFLVYARDILDLMRKAKDDISSFHGELVGRVIVGMPTSVGFYGFSKFLKTFIARYPKIEVVFQLQDPEIVLEKLMAGETDFGLLPGIAAQPGLLVEPLFEDSWALVCGPKHPLAHKRGLPPQELGSQPFLVLEESHRGHDDVLDQVFTKHRLSPPILLQADDMETLKRMAMDNWGLVVLPQRMIREELKKGTLIDLKVKEFRRVHAVSLAYRSDRFPSEAEEKFLQALSETYKKN